MGLHTAESRFGHRARALGVLPSRMAELPTHAFWLREDRAAIVPDRMHLTATLPAFVNAGRWLVQCVCGSAQLASAGDHRFHCVECGNSAADERWVRVVWPDDAAEIEEVLLHRPDLHTRSWQPGETVPALRAENRARGLPG